MIRECSPEKNEKRLWRKGFVKEVSFKSGLKSRGSSEGGDCDEVICAG